MHPCSSRAFQGWYQKHNAPLWEIAMWQTKDTKQITTFLQCKCPLIFPENTHAHIGTSNCENLDFVPFSDTLGVFFWGVQSVNFFKNFCAWVMSQRNQGSPSFQKKKKKKKKHCNFKVWKFIYFPFWWCLGFIWFWECSKGEIIQIVIFGGGDEPIKLRKPIN